MDIYAGVMNVDDVDCSSCILHARHDENKTVFFSTRKLMD